MRLSDAGERRRRPPRPRLPPASAEHPLGSGFVNSAPAHVGARTTKPAPGGFRSSRNSCLAGTPPGDRRSAKSLPSTAPDRHVPTAPRRACISSLPGRTRTRRRFQGLGATKCRSPHHKTGAECEAEHRNRSRVRADPAANGAAPSRHTHVPLQLHSAPVSRTRRHQMSEPTPQNRSRAAGSAEPRAKPWELPARLRVNHRLEPRRPGCRRAVPDDLGSQRRPEKRWVQHRSRRRHQVVDGGQDLRGPRIAVDGQAGSVPCPTRSSPPGRRSAERRRSAVAHPGQRRCSTAVPPSRRTDASAFAHRPVRRPAAS